jgi:hypothetical protein
MSFFMFKIIVLILLLLLLSGTVSRRILRVLMIAGLIILLIREIKKLDIDHMSFVQSSAVSLCSSSFTLSDDQSYDIPVAKGCVLHLRSAFGGAVKISGWNKPFVRMICTKKAATQEDLERIELKVQTDARSKNAASKRIDIAGGAQGSICSAADGSIRASWTSNGWSSQMPRVDYELHVPKKKMKSISCKIRSGLIAMQSFAVHDAVNAHTKNGEIKISDIHGNVFGESQSGGISLSNIAGNLAVEVKSGLVDLQNIQGNVSVDSRSGSIQLAEIAGSVKVETKSGPTSARGIQGKTQVGTRSGTIVLDGVARSTDASTRSGAVTITRSKKSSGTIRAQSRSGHIIIRDSTGDILAQGRGQIVVK